jgi:hypothetical protein
MSPSNKAIVWFNEVGKKDVAYVGGKGANLGELTNAQIPVPPGFIVTPCLLPVLGESPDHAGNPSEINDAGHP